MSSIPIVLYTNFDDILGFLIGKSDHKTAAFVDDILFFITSPETTLPNLLSEFNRYTALSNFKINIQKSELLNITLSPARVQTHQSSFSFPWAASHLTYLGVKLTPSVEKKNSS